MERVAVARLAEMGHAAGHEEAGEAPVEAAPVLAFGVEEAGRGETSGRLPGDLDAADPERADVHRPVGEDPEVEAAAGGEGQRPHAALRTVVERDPADARDLAQVADPRAQIGEVVEGHGAAEAGEVARSEGRSRRTNASGGAWLAAMRSVIAAAMRASRSGSSSGVSCAGSVSRS